MSQPCFISKIPNQGARSLLLEEATLCSGGTFLFIKNLIFDFTKALQSSINYRKAIFFGLERKKKERGKKTLELVHHESQRALDYGSVKKYHKNKTINCSNNLQIQATLSLFVNVLKMSQNFNNLTTRLLVFQESFLMKNKID